MDVMEFIQAISRWAHVVAGIMWIGLLYWFNFVNIPAIAKIQASTKQDFMPEYGARALYWFRWGAVWTWLTGVLLLLLVFYHGGALFDMMDEPWTVGAITMIAVTFLGVVVYDILYKTVLKKNDIIATVISLVIYSAILFLFEWWAGFGYRGYVIHTGTLFGTIMAFNVWMRIWPAQKVIIPAIKAGEAPDAELGALAMMRSKHNTYLSVPLVWTMINMHTVTTGAGSRYSMFLAVVVGWLIVYWLYKKSATVKGM